jgi:hypothetical protein
MAVGKNRTPEADTASAKVTTAIQGINPPDWRATQLVVNPGNGVKMQCVVNNDQRIMKVYLSSISGLYIRIAGFFLDHSIPVITNSCLLVTCSLQNIIFCTDCASPQVAIPADHMIRMRRQSPPSMTGNLRSLRSLPGFIPWSVASVANRISVLTNWSGHPHRNARPKVHDADA